MKTTGIVIFIIGLVMTVFTSFQFFTKEKVVDIGAVEISRDKPHNVTWSPLIGIGVMALGGGLLLLKTSKK